MGGEKKDLEQKEEVWRRKCQYEGWICAVCGKIPPLSDNQIYFETKMCGHCAHQARMDD